MIQQQITIDNARSYYMLIDLNKILRPRTQDESYEIAIAS